MPTIRAKLVDLEEKYRRLVWYSRTNPEEQSERMEEISDLYPDEIVKLENCENSWQHGFNSGMLAAARLLRAYALPNNYQKTLPPDEEDQEPLIQTRDTEIHREENQFPFLDT